MAALLCFACAMLGVDKLGQEHTGSAETSRGNANAWIPSRHEAGKKAGRFFVLAEVSLLENY